MSIEIAAGWPQGVGTVLTVVGLLVVAPQASGAALAALPLSLLNLLARVLPLRRPVSGTLKGASVGRLQFSGYGRGKRPWDPGASVDDQLSQLRDAVDNLEKLHDELQQRVTDVENKAREMLLAEIEKVEQRIADIEARIANAERDEHEIQTAGFPPAALGALLAGVPEWFADRPVLTLVCFGLGALSLVRARRAIGATGHAFVTAFTDAGFFRQRVAATQSPRE